MIFGYQKGKIENRLSDFIAIGLFLPVIKFCIVQSIPGLVAYNSIANALIGVLMLLLFARNLPVILKRSAKYAFGLGCVLLMLFISTLAFNGENFSNTLAAAPDILIISSTLFLTAVSITDFDLLYEKLSKWAPIAIAFAIFMVVCTSIIGVVGTAETSYNMSLSYYTLVPTLLMYSNFVYRKKIVYILFFVAGVFVVLFMGSRGPLVCILLFVLLFSLKTLKLSVSNMLILAAVIGIGIFIFVNYVDIANFLYSWLLEHNIESRTLHKLLIGEFFDDSDRRSIINEAMFVISQKPFGIGFMGDLRTHNILVENLLWFGWLFGSLINIFLIYKVIRTVFIKMFKHNKLSCLILIFFSYAIPDALLNLTVWGKDMFWIYLALMCCYPAVLRDRRRYRESQHHRHHHYDHSDYSDSED